MIVDTAAMVKSMKDDGLSAEDSVKKGLGEKYQVWAWNFITEEKWINTLYKGQ